MTNQPLRNQSESQEPAFWRPDVLEAFNALCQSEGMNPVRLRKLVDRYVETKRKPSRQELIDALKHRPRIQERATIIGSVTKKLNIFIEAYI
jgi:hypothetical protein